MYGIKLQDTIDAAASEIIEMFKKALAKVPQLQEELVLYFKSISTISEDRERLLNAIEFLNSLGRLECSKES